MKVKNKDKNKRINLKLDAKTDYKLRQLALQTHRTLTGVITLGINKVWESEK